MADHAVRAMSSYPVANNPYYGVDYRSRPAANDLSWYKNIPVPMSYMVCQTRGDFFGGYDYQAGGGFVHVADRHIAPGKKQWTWGDHAFGHAWDRELTDANGPYIELMARVPDGQGVLMLDYRPPDPRTHTREREVATVPEPPAAMPSADELYFTGAMDTPENLGEAYHLLQARRNAENHLLLALALHGLGDSTAARAALDHTLAFTHADQRALDLQRELRGHPPS